MASSIPNSGPAGSLPGRFQISLKVGHLSTLKARPGDLVFPHSSLHLQRVIPHRGENSQWRIRLDGGQIRTQALLVFSRFPMTKNATLLPKNDHSFLGIARPADISKRVEIGN